MKPVLQIVTTQQLCIMLIFEKYIVVLYEKITRRANEFIAITVLDSNFIIFSIIPSMKV